MAAKKIPLWPAAIFTLGELLSCLQYILGKTDILIIGTKDGFLDPFGESAKGGEFFLSQVHLFLCEQASPGGWFVEVRAR